MKVSPADAFNHDKMFKFPKGDQRKPHPRQLVDLLLESGRLHSVSASGLEDIASAGSISGDIAGVTHLFQRHPASVMCKHDRKGRRSAFGGFHLKDCRRPYPPRRPPSHRAKPFNYA